METSEPRIFLIRQRLGWPQRKLAEHLGVSQPTVARLEGGQREPGPIRRLLDLLEKKSAPSADNRGAQS